VETGRVPPHTLAIASAAVVFLVFISVGATTQLLHPGFGVWFTELFIFIGLPRVLTRGGLRDPVRCPGLQSPGFAPVALGFILGLVNFFAVVVPIQYLAQTIAPESWTEFFDSSRIFREQSRGDLVLIITGVTLAAPVCEEYFFRGVLQHGVSERGHALRALVITSVLFSLFHFDPVGFLARVELGLLFGWLFLKTGSIWPGVLAHLANNGISTVLFFLQDSTEPQTATATTAEELVQVASFAAVGLLLLAGVWLLVRSRPGLLERKVDHGGTLPTVSFWKTSAPWIVGAVASLVLLGVLDYRRVRIRIIDQIYPVPSELAPRLEEARESLDGLRRRARRGELSLDTYRAERMALAQRAAKANGEPEAPVPETAPPPVPQKL